MKARKNLYLWSGILNCIYGAVVCFFSLLILLLGKVVRKFFESSQELVDEFINGMAEADSSYQYLLDLSREQAVDYIMKMTNTIFIILLIMGILSIVLGVINVKLRNKYDYAFSGKKLKKILFVVATWLVTNVVCAVLTTIAVFIKVKDKDKNKLYVSDDTININ